MLKECPKSTTWTNPNDTYTIMAFSTNCYAFVLCWIVHVSRLCRQAHWMAHSVLYQAVASRLISICREIFQTYGAHEELSTDGWPPFSGYSFQQFLKYWAVKQRISSIAYLQSNGWAKLAVKTAKRLIRDCTGHQGSLDNDMAAQAILQYRKIPIQGIGLSPAQLLLHIRLWDYIPSHLHLYKPHPEWIATAQKCEKTLSKCNADLIKRFNHTAHALSPLCKGDTVSIQNPNSHRWDITGRIVETLPNHQYRIRVAGSGRITLQNSRFLRKLKIPIIATPIPSASVTWANNYRYEYTTSTCQKNSKWWHLYCKETRNPRARLNHCHQEPGIPGRYLNYFHTLSQEIRNWFRPNDNYASAMWRGGRYRSQMTHLLTWLPSWIFLEKASQLCLPHFIGEHLMQQVGCSVVPVWPAQHICMNGVYSPIYSSSKWQWE